MSNKQASQNKIKYVITDFDGTLMPPGENKIPEDTIDAIEQLQNEGVEVLVATARHWESFRSASSPLNLPCIASAGAQFRDSSGNVIFNNSITQDIAIEAMKYLEKNAVPFCALFDKPTPEIVFDDSLPIPPEILSYAGESGVYGDAKMSAGLFDTLQIAVFCHDDVDQLRKIAQIITDMGTCVDVYEEINFGGWNLNALSNKAGKWNAIQWYCEQLNIDPESICAIGDGENDNEMIANVGLGVAMPHAAQSTKNVAKAVLQKGQNWNSVVELIHEH